MWTEEIQKIEVKFFLEKEKGCQKKKIMMYIILKSTRTKNISSAVFLTYHVLYSIFNDCFHNSDLLYDLINQWSWKISVLGGPIYLVVIETLGYSVFIFSVVQFVYSYRKKSRFK